MTRQVFRAPFCATGIRPQKDLEPPERQDVPERIQRRLDALLLKCLNRASELLGVSVDDDRGEEFGSCDPEVQCLGCPVAYFSARPSE